MKYQYGHTTVVAAADSVEELAFLRAIAADLADVAPKLVYADWLDERDDPRGVFLRTFVEQMRQGGRLPSLRQWPASWCQVVGLRLVELIRKYKAHAIERELLQRARPVLFIKTKARADKSIPVGETKFGGYPDLPPGSAWPADDFCGQIRLDHLQQTLVGQQFPATGLLSFFLQDGYIGHVMYSNNVQELQRLPPPEPPGEYADMLANGGTLTFYEGMTIPVTKAMLGDLVARLPGDAPDLCRAWSALESTFKVRATLHQLLGYCGPINARPEPESNTGLRHLMRFSDDETLAWEWGDSHTPYFFIPDADLTAGRFDRAGAMIA